ncbi:MULTISPECIES: LysE family translocator [Bacillus]|uniref:LysE family translocator n=1 Tax=Bacillus TaxID=1386 RepID=UPI0006175B84|nr:MULTISPECIES: LysE family translocator [Bacillus]KKB73718.1 amino acid transporter [Bacillus sp. TH008]MDU0072371.1 LysE family translocator [Bacillus sp. IG6]MED8020164.1 LysE family translocator [Bacillus glycinifermentans]WKB79584.1 LysE family translocator [Bacillus glycinifermentans]
MNIFLSYVFLGLSLAAPVGPVNAAQIDRGMKGGFFHAWLFGLGAVTADVLYMALIYFGVAQFLTAPFLKTFLWLFGFFVLTYTGIESLAKAKEVSLMRGRRETESYRKSFLSGLVISLSNPLSIMFWLGIYGSILAKTIETYASYQLLLCSSGILIGLFLWDLAMSFVAGTFRTYLSPRMMLVTSWIAGITLIVFGLYFGYQGIHALIRPAR